MAETNTAHAPADRADSTSDKSAEASSKGSVRSLISSIFSRKSTNKSIKSNSTGPPSTRKLSQELDNVPRDDAGEDELDVNALSEQLVAALQSMPVDQADIMGNVTVGSSRFGPQVFSVTSSETPQAASKSADKQLPPNKRLRNFLCASANPDDAWADLARPTLASAPSDTMQTQKLKTGGMQPHPSGDRRTIYVPRYTSQSHSVSTAGGTYKRKVKRAPSALTPAARKKKGPRKRVQGAAAGQGSLKPSLARAEQPVLDPKKRDSAVVVGTGPLLQQEQQEEQPLEVRPASDSVQTLPSHPHRASIYSKNPIALETPSSRRPNPKLHRPASVHSTEWVKAYVSDAPKPTPVRKTKCGPSQKSSRASSPRSASSSPSRSISTPSSHRRRSIPHEATPSSSSQLEPKSNLRPPSPVFIPTPPPLFLSPKHVPIAKQVIEEEQTLAELALATQRIRAAKKHNTTSSTKFKPPPRTRSSTATTSSTNSSRSKTTPAPALPRACGAAGNSPKPDVRRESKWKKEVELGVRDADPAAYYAGKMTGGRWSWGVSRELQRLERRGAVTGLGDARQSRGRSRSHRPCEARSSVAGCDNDYDDGDDYDYDDDDDGGGGGGAGLGMKGKGKAMSERPKSLCTPDGKLDDAA